jgi:polysaccharide pyruvyl transferase WcaK-like protein
MRTGIVGWFGSDNLGDEILLHALLDCVRGIEPDAACIVIAPDPDRVAALHSVDAIAMPTLRGAGAVRRTTSVYLAVRDCDVVFLGPGTVFQERSPNLRWPGTLPMFGRLVALARLAGTPVAAVGVGVREGGTHVGRWLLDSLGAACLAVGARDRRSASYLGRRAQVVGDLAYALPLPALTPPTAPRFAVSARPLGADLERPLLAALRDCADRLVTDGWTGAFLPMAFGRGARGEDDRILHERHFRGVLDLADNPLAEAGPLAPALGGWLCALGGYRLVVATRLHAALLAAALGVPTVAVAYERKVRDAFADLGLGRYVVPPDADASALYRAATVAAAARADFGEAAARAARQGRVARAFVAGALREVG